GAAFPGQRDVLLMDSLQPVLAVLARVLVGFSAAFLVPLGWALGIGEEGEARIWGYALAMTLGLGVLLGWVLRRHTRELQPRDAFLLVTLVWVVLPACAAVPLLYTVPRMYWAPAYFEAMSAFTATGGT